MRKKTPLLIILATCLVFISPLPVESLPSGKAGDIKLIVASNTILSSMIVALLPEDRYAVEAILPPGQCPGHYDVKPSDIRKMQKANLTVLTKGALFADKNQLASTAKLMVDQQGANWMAPDSYLRGLEFIAAALAKHFPENKKEIKKRKENTIRSVQAQAQALKEKIKQGGIFGKPVLAASLQKEPLIWMGFQVAGEYGRPEAMSAKDILRLEKIGREQRIIMVIDNIQSGPDAGKGLAETLGVPHVKLTNFPSEKGYLATLGENVDALLKAVHRK